MVISFESYCLDRQTHLTVCSIWSTKVVGKKIEFQAALYALHDKMRAIATDRVAWSVCLCVCLSVCLLITFVSRTKIS